MSRIPVYFMPGLAASSLIFENIRLPESQFEMVMLEWELPLDNESLDEYAARISKKVVHKDPVLIGVSFGGIVVQEMAKFVHPRKVVIISSVKCNAELPRRMRVARATRLYKLLPVGLVPKIEHLTRFTFGKYIDERIRLYKKYLSIRDKKYLSWAIEQVILWTRTEPDPTVVHIHGDSDEIFPAKYIRNFISVKGGTHIMIINRFKWMNENLPRIILDKKTDQIL